MITLRYARRDAGAAVFFRGYALMFRDHMPREAARAAPMPPRDVLRCALRRR